MNLLDFLFPKFCVSCKRIGSYICPLCFARLSFSHKTMCFLCGKYAIDGLTHPICQKNSSLDGCFIVMEYTMVIKRLIYHFKYQPYVGDVYKIIVDLLYEGIIQKEALMMILAKEKECVMIPIPLHSNKLRERGYNHAALMAKHLSEKLHLVYHEYLFRNKQTLTQAGLSKQERKANMRDAFSLKKQWIVVGQTIFLVDDIVTTGVTFIEAAKVLKKAGAKSVYGIAFAGEN